MNLQRYGQLPYCLKRLGEDDLPLVHMEALRVQCMRDVRQGHRRVERVVLSHSVVVIRYASVSARCFSSASRASATLLLCSIWFLFASVTASASLRSNR
jgi:hypothetical protein